MYEKRKKREYPGWDKDVNGLYINQDGSLRKCKKNDPETIKNNNHKITGHREGSLGEDQESILI